MQSLLTCSEEHLNYLLYFIASFFIFFIAYVCLRHLQSFCFTTRGLNMIPLIYATVQGNMRFSRLGAFSPSSCHSQSHAQIFYLWWQDCTPTFHRHSGSTWCQNPITCYVAHSQRQSGSNIGGGALKHSEHLLSTRPLQFVQQRFRVIYFFN